jgi:hypothetical protein
MKIKGAWAKHSILDLAEKLKLSTAALHQALEQRTLEAMSAPTSRAVPEVEWTERRRSSSMGIVMVVASTLKTVVSAIHQAMGTAKSA